MTPHKQDYHTIPLTKGQVAKVSPEDYEALSAKKWHAHWNSHTKSYYAARNERGVDGKWHVLLMHRLIKGFPFMDARQVDHEDLDTLNNQRWNLREADKHQQQQNHRRRKDNSTGFKGVDFRRANSNYRARIGVGGKMVTLGVRKTAEAAHRELYVPAALKLHGEFARVA